MSVSLPPDLFKKAEERAAALGFKRATYIQQLILADLKAAEEKTKPPTPTSSNTASAGKQRKRK